MVLGMGEDSWHPLTEVEHRNGVAAVFSDESEGGLWLTGDVDDGGTMLEGFEPAVELGDEQTVVGGRLPRGATAALVADRAGDLHSATIGDEAWLIVLDGSVGW